MSKYTTLVLSLIILVAISAYAGIWMTYSTIEGATNMDSNTIPTTMEHSTSTPSIPIGGGGTVPTELPSPDVQKLSENGVSPHNSTINVSPSTPIIDISNIDTKTKYNSDNLNVEYHDNLQATGSNGIYNTQMGTSQVYDVNGNLVDVVSNAVQGNIVYYQPGSYKYGATSYVPYYEDSVFLSRTTNAIVNSPAYITSNIGGGFCNKYKTDSIKLEQQCNAINNETCAATTCCVLLGGQKCVAGAENGPLMKDNYSDFMIANKDFYYYQGKCYGNCPNTPQFPFPTLPEKLPYMPSPPGAFPPSTT